MHGLYYICFYNGQIGRHRLFEGVVYSLIHGSLQCYYEGIVKTFTTDMNYVSDVCVYKYIIFQIN